MDVFNIHTNKGGDKTKNKFLQKEDIIKYHYSGDYLLNLHNQKTPNASSVFFLAFFSFFLAFKKYYLGVFFNILNMNAIAQPLNYI